MVCEINLWKTNRHWRKNKRQNFAFGIIVFFVKTWFSDRFFFFFYLICFLLFEGMSGSKSLHKNDGIEVWCWSGGEGGGLSFLEILWSVDFKYQTTGDANKREKIRMLVCCSDGGFEGVASYLKRFGISAVGYRGWWWTPGGWGEWKKCIADCHSDQKKESFSTLLSRYTSVFLSKIKQNALFFLYETEKMYLSICLSIY